MAQQRLFHTVFFNALFQNDKAVRYYYREKIYLAKYWQTTDPCFFPCRHQPPYTDLKYASKSFRGKNRKKSERDPGFTIKQNPFSMRICAPETEFTQFPQIFQPKNYIMYFFPKILQISFCYSQPLENSLRLLVWCIFFMNILEGSRSSSGFCLI